MATNSTIAKDIAHDALSAGILGTYDNWDPNEYVMTEEDCEYAFEQGAKDEDLNDIRRIIVDMLLVAKEEAEEEWRAEQEYERQQEFKRPYCSDRTCGATDCSRCYPW